jgi:hypothetical protein
VLFGQEPLGTRELRHALEEGLGDVAAQQPVPVLLGRRRSRPTPVRPWQPDKPAKEQIVPQLFHQQPLAAQRVEDLEEHCWSSFSGTLDGRPVLA